MTTTKNNEHKKLNFSSEREQSQACLNSAEHEKNQGRKVLNVPNLRFPEFQGEWEEHYLSDYLDFKNGLNPKPDIFGRGIKFISVMDILNNTVITNDCIRVSVDVSEEELHNFCVENGDMLFQRSSETLEDVGRANVYMDDKPAVFGGFVIRGKKKAEYNPLFFRYLLASPFARRKIIPMGAGAQHFNIGQEGLHRVKLHFASLDEQKKIATFLSLLDERIATQNKIIEDLKKLKSAIAETVFNNMQGHLTSLSAICNIVKGKQVNGEELSEKGKYYVMNGGITPSGYYDQCNTPANTISVSEGGNSCGYVQYNKSSFWSGGHCYTLQDITSGVDTQYLFHYLKRYESNIMNLRIGTGLPNIQKKDLENFRIALPPSNVQKEISTCLTAIEDKIMVEVKWLDSTQKEKLYLLRQMFI